MQFRGTSWQRRCLKVSPERVAKVAASTVLPSNRAAVRAAFISVPVWGLLVLICCFIYGNKSVAIRHSRERRIKVQGARAARQIADRNPALIFPDMTPQSGTAA